ncbi:hypothetical protein [Fibrobacter sp. UWH4]|uniref:hypothetical protein n=1 Tax=Fibrobacter sp. UWH4 TaxID=1896210 RepID=UPI00091B6D76|nr:hypothetical protein [Fibrobacter sp. UWH4]SHL04747.1 hypothetical protein SAMN05720762_10455 [Fibrobacter sp. UWH4]
MADENSFVQVIKFKVDDSDLRAAIERMRAAFGEGGSGKDPTANLEKGIKKAGNEARKTASETEKIGKASKDAAKETDRLSKSFGGLTGAIKGAVAAYAGFQGISKLIGFGKGSIAAYSAQKRQELMLDTVLKNNGMGEASGYIKNAASELQKRTTIGDEAMIAGAAELSTYVRNSQQLKRMMGLLADYSMGMTGGAEMSPEAMTNLATGLGKAFDGTYEAMRRKGFDTSELEQISAAMKLKEDLEKGNVARDKKTGELKLSNDDKELLKWLKENEGKSLEDLKVTALENALKDWKGLAEEFASTDEGKILQLKNDIGDLREDVGKMLLPVLGELAAEVRKNLPLIKDFFNSLGNLIKRFIEVVISRKNEIANTFQALTDAINLFAKAPVEIMAFVTAMKLIGPAMFQARTSALEMGAAVKVMGKAMSGIAKGGLMALTVWAIEKIAEAAKAGKEYLGEESKRIDRDHHYADFSEAMRHVSSAQEFQKKLGLSSEEIAVARGKMSSIPSGIDLNNVRDPRVGMMFAGLSQGQIDWMKYEFDKRTWRAKADSATAKMNAVGASGKGSQEMNLQEQMNKELAGLTKGDTNITNINYTNNIEANSDLMAKAIKENLRMLLTSNLSMITRSEGAKALAL